MKTVGSSEAKAHLPRLLERVAYGEEFTITRHGKPIAQLVPAVRSQPRSDVKQVIAEWKAFSKGNTLGEGLTIHEMIHTSR